MAQQAQAMLVLWGEAAALHPLAHFYMPMRVVAAAAVHQGQAQAAAVAQGWWAMVAMAPQAQGAQGQAAGLVVQQALATLQRLQVVARVYHQAGLETVVARVLLAQAAAVLGLGWLQALLGFRVGRAVRQPHPSARHQAAQQEMPEMLARLCPMVLAEAVTVHRQPVQRAAQGGNPVVAAGAGEAALRQVALVAQVGAAKYACGSGKMQNEQKRYKVILTEPRFVGEEMLAVGSTVNTIIWDGVSPFTPETGTRLEEE